MGQTGRAPREEVAGQHFILYSRKSYTSQLLDRHLERERIVPRSFIELGSVEAIKELVKLGLGISVLAPWVFRRELHEGALVAVPLGRQKLKRRWGITYWRGRRLSLPEEAFLGLCYSATAGLAKL